MNEPSGLLLSVSDRLDPRRSALLVIDMQNDFCAEGGYIETVVGRDASPCRAVAGPVMELVSSARAATVPVIWVTANYDPAIISKPMRAKQLEKGTAGCCVRASWGADFYSVAPKQGEKILAKHSYSAFIGTDLATSLAGAGRDVLVFAGVQTNVCVEHSVRDAFAYGFYCVVAEDCVASHMQPLHEAALKNIGFLYGDVIGRTAIAQHWRGEHN